PPATLRVVSREALQPTSRFAAHRVVLMRSGTPTPPAHPPSTATRAPPSGEARTNAHHQSDAGESRKIPRLPEPIGDPPEAFLQGFGRRRHRLLDPRLRAAQQLELRVLVKIDDTPIPEDPK